MQTEACKLNIRKSIQAISSTLPIQKTDTGHSWNATDRVLEDVLLFKLQMLLRTVQIKADCQCLNSQSIYIEKGKCRYSVYRIGWILTTVYTE